MPLRKRIDNRSTWISPKGTGTGDWCCTPRVVVEEIQKSVQTCVGNSDLLALGNASKRDRAGLMSQVVRHLGTKPGRRLKSVGLRPRVEINGDAVDGSWGDKMVKAELGRVCCAKVHAGERYFPDTHIEKCFGMCARNLCALFYSLPATETRTK